MHVIYSWFLQYQSFSSTFYALFTDDDVAIAKHFGSIALESASKYVQVDNDEQAPKQFSRYLYYYSLTNPDNPESSFAKWGHVMDPDQLFVERNLYTKMIVNLPNGSIHNSSGKAASSIYPFKGQGKVFTQLSYKSEPELSICYYNGYPGFNGECKSVPRGFFIQLGMYVGFAIVHSYFNVEDAVHLYYKQPPIGYGIAAFGHVGYLVKYEMVGSMFASPISAPFILDSTQHKEAIDKLPFKKVQVPPQVPGNIPTNMSRIDEDNNESSDGDNNDENDNANIGTSSSSSNMIFSTASNSNVTNDNVVSNTDTNTINSDDYCFIHIKGESSCCTWNDGAYIWNTTSNNGSFYKRIDAKIGHAQWFFRHYHRVYQALADIPSEEYPPSLCKPTIWYGHFSIMIQMHFIDISTTATGVPNDNTSNSNNTLTTEETESVANAIVWLARRGLFYTDLRYKNIITKPKHSQHKVAAVLIDYDDIILCHPMTTYNEFKNYIDQHPSTDIRFVLWHPNTQGSFTNPILQSIKTCYSNANQNTNVTLPTNLANIIEIDKAEYQAFMVKK